MTVPPTLVAEYFSAIVNNDIDTLRELLDAGDGVIEVDINSIASDGSTALQVALEQEHYDLADILINRRIKGGLTLLRMVEADEPKAVEYLCRKYKTFKSYREDIFSSRISDDEFPPETTPVTLAARLNRYLILKILMQYGARMPTLEETRKQFSGRRPGRERAISQLCEARSSEVHLLQTSPDILRDAFRLTEQLRETRLEEQNSLEKFGERDDYTILEERLHKIAVKVLDFTNAEEVESLLKGSDAERSLSQVSGCCGRGQSANVPVRLSQGLLMKYKEFIAHKKLQEFLWRHWRSGFSEIIERSFVRRFVATSCLALFWPIFCLLYLVLSGFEEKCEPFLRIMKAPYVKFILHASSRVTFLLVLIGRSFDYEQTFFTIDSNDIVNGTVEHIDALRQEYIGYKAHSYYGVVGIAMFWVAGMTWREITELRDQGKKMYLNIGSGLVDIPQIVLYWIYFISRMAALNQVQRYVQNENWLENLLEKNTFKPTTACGSKTLPNSNCTTVYEESRLDWDSTEPILIAEAAFAVASVFTFFRLLDTTVLIAGLGALLVSFKKMFAPIIKFLSLFAFIWISFALGTTHLYRSFEQAIQEACTHNHPTTNQHDCEDIHPRFINLWFSLTTYFWMLFGKGGLDYFSLPDNLRFSEDMGWLVYALWHIAVVMFLMKILIGLTSAVYSKIQDHADTEWKFAMTKLVSEYMTDRAIVPPPFNLIPSTASIIGCFKAIQNSLNKDRHITDEDKLQHRRAKTIRLEERQQKKAIRLTQNYKMISNVVRRRYARFIMKEQHKISPTCDLLTTTRNQEQTSQKPESTAELRQIQTTCNKLTADLKMLQQTMDDLMLMMHRPKAEYDSATEKLP